MKTKLMVLIALALSMNLFTSCLTTDLINSGISSSFSSKQEKFATTDYDEDSTCLIYGLQLDGGEISNIEFIQTDSRKKPSRITNHATTKGLFLNCQFYYGEAICGGNYKLNRKYSSSSSVDGLGNRYTTIYNYNYGITGGSLFDFKAPAKPRVYFLGAKSVNGKAYNNEYFESDVKNAIGKPTDEKVEKYNLKMQIKAVEKLQSIYKGTKWEPLLKEEYDSLVAKNGGKND